MWWRRGGVGGWGEKFGVEVCDWGRRCIEASGMNERDGLTFFELGGLVLLHRDIECSDNCLWTLSFLSILFE